MASNEPDLISRKTLARIATVAACAALCALACNALRPNGAIAPVRPSQADLVLKEGITPVHLDTAMILHADTNFLFVDARPANVYRRAHIPRATSLPEEDFDSLYPGFEARVPKNRPLVVYCDGVECRSSEILSRKLKEKGYRFVHCFFGGWVEWRDAKLEVEK
jgi:rhodanese-related sulfurtransferase